MCLIYIRLFLAAFFWGGAFIAGKIAVKHATPALASFLQFGISSVVLLALVFVGERRFPQLTLRQWRIIAVLGLSGIALYNICFFNGLERIDAGRASMIVATSPIFITIASTVLLRERLSVLGILGVMISFCGAATVISRGDFAALFAGGRFGLGELFILGAVLCWGTYTIMGRFIMSEVSPLVAVAYSSTIGAALLFIPACGEGFGNIASYPLETWFALAFMILFATVLAYLWFYQGIKQLGAARAGLFLNFVPISGVLLAWLILHEAITLSLIIGGVLVLLGIYLINRPRRGSAG